MPRLVSTWKYSKSKKKSNSQVDGHSFACRGHLALLSSSFEFPSCFFSLSVGWLFTTNTSPALSVSQTPSSHKNLISLLSPNWILWLVPNKQVAVGAVCPRSQHLRSYLLRLTRPTTWRHPQRRPGRQNQEDQATKSKPSHLTMSQKCHDKSNKLKRKMTLHCSVVWY